MKYINDKTTAETNGSEQLATIISPVPRGLATLARVLKSELTSSGGRPARRGEVSSHKLKLAKEEWSKLKLLAQDLRSHYGVTASPAQIASMYVRNGLKSRA